MKIYHLLLLVWVIIVTLWMFNQTRPKKKPVTRRSTPPAVTHTPPAAE